MLLQIAACSDNGVVNDESPCQGQTCSGHGQCAVAGDTPVCLCDAGYRPDGLACLAITPGAECDGVSCSGHGDCIVANGSPDYPICLCDSGYDPLGLECVSDSGTSPCDGQTCSDHGQCAVVSGDTAVCVCDGGYHSASGGLACEQNVAGDVCQGVDCSGGVCRNVDGSPVCTCGTGFHPVGPTTCVADEPPAEFDLAASRAVFFGYPTISVAAGDLDGDGMLDLAGIVSTNGDIQNKLAIVYATGPRTFSSPVYLSMGVKPTAVALADLNSDDRLDLVTSNSNAVALPQPPDNPNGVTFRLATGPTTYGAETRLSMTSDSSYPFSAMDLSVADLNKDGRPDLIVPSFIYGVVSIRLATGDGAFGAFRLLPVGTNPYKLAVGDVNEDGHLDIVVSLRANGVALLRATDDAGNFAASQPLAIGTGPSDVEGVGLADLNADGHLDIAVLNRSGTNKGVGVLLTSGAANTFGSAQVLDFAVPGKPSSYYLGLRLADVTGDGQADVLVGSESAWLVRAGQGSGLFADIVSYPSYSSTGTPLVTDLDGDGAQDVLLPSGGDGTGTSRGGGASVSYGTLTSTYPRPAQYFTPLGTNSQNKLAAMRVTDLNGDGLLDVVLSALNTFSNADSKIYVVLGQGSNGSFASTPGELSVSPFNIAVADLNGDERLDIMALGNGTGFAPNSGLHYFVQDVAGAFSLSPATFSPMYLTGNATTPPGFATADFNGDGRVDLAVADSDAGEVLVYLASGPAGSFSDGTGYAVGNQPTAVAAGDLDGDGVLDLCVANFGGDSVSVLHGSAATPGTFGAASSFSTDEGPSSLALADLDRDGTTDLVVGTWTGGSVSVLLGLSAVPGLFWPAVTYSSSQTASVQTGIRSVTVADLDQDDRPDIVAADYIRGDLMVLLARGSAGSFEAPRHFAAGSGVVSVASADINGDEFPDLVVANQHNAITTILNASHW